MGSNTLYTISFSHFCEAGRWALEASNIEFREVQALPGLHRLLLPPKDPSGNKVTPYLCKTDGEFLNSSWEILEWSGRGEIPKEVKELLDGTVGPAIRSIFYSYSLYHPSLDHHIRQASLLQRTLWTVAGRSIKRVMYKLMVKDEEYIEGEKVRLHSGWRHLQDLLQSPSQNPFQALPDGKPNSASIALCAIAGALLFPENQFGCALKPAPLEEAPDGLQQLCLQYRATALGEFVLRTYRETRMLPASRST